MKRIYIAFLCALATVSANAVTITLNGNGGTVEGDPSKSYELAGDDLVLPVPVKTDYHFVGWFEDKTTTLQDYNANNVVAGKEYQPGTYLYGTSYSQIPSTQASDMTLYAKWVKQSTYDKFHGKKLAVMGDSVSTLYGYPSPWGNLYYDETWRDGYGVDVHSQWWGQIKDALDMELSAISVGGGSGVTCMTYEFGTERRAMMNYTRIGELGTNGAPDLVIIAAGINDYGVATDAFNPDAVYLTNRLDRASTVCSGFAEGYALMIRRIRDMYPDAEIVSLATYDVGAGVENGNGVITNTCPLYNAVAIDLRNLFLDRAGDGITYKVNGVHPGVGGLSAIANAFLENYAPIASPVVIPEAGHDWGFGVITTPATAEADGVRTYTCRQCAATRTEPVAYVAPAEGTEIDLTSLRSGVGVYLENGTPFPVTSSPAAIPRTGSLTPIADAFDGDESTAYQDTTLARRYIAVTFADPVIVTGVQLVSSSGKYPNLIYVSDNNGHLLGYTDKGIEWQKAPVSKHVSTIVTTDRTPVREVRLSFDFEDVGRTLDLKEMHVLGYSANGERIITLDAKGGSVADDATNIVYTADDETFALPTPTRSGYHFIGWFKDDTFHYGKLLSGTPVTQIEKGSSLDGVLYAKWISESCDFYQHFQGKRYAVMGDSTSTYYEYPSPVYYYDYYTSEVCANNGVTEQTTWWGQLAQACGMTHIYHDAIAGSQLAYTGGNAAECSRAMMNYSGRLNHLGAVDQPDVLFIFGGINDYQKSSATVDDFDPEASYLTGDLDKTTTTASGFAHGLALLIRRIKDALPDTEIVMIAPYKAYAYSDELCAKGNATMAAVCNYFGITCIDLAQSDMHVGMQPAPQYSGNTDGYMYTLDSLHPSNLGFHLMAEYIIDNYTIPCAHEDSETISSKILPTCTEDGTNAVIYCNDCGKYLSTATVIPALGHDLRDDWTTNTAATCTADGSRSRHCHRTGCNFGEDEVLPLLGHDWDAGVVTTAPTKSSTGVRTYTCGRCSATKTETIPMLPSVDYARNVALASYAGSVPALPAEVAGLGSDGVASGSFPVAWDTDDVSFDNVGTVVVTGAVDGIAAPVTASVRLIEPPSSGLVNINSEISSITAVSAANPGKTVYTAGFEPENCLDAAYTDGEWGANYDKEYCTWGLNGCADWSFETTFALTGATQVKRVDICMYDKSVTGVTLHYGDNQSVAFTSLGYGPAGYLKVSQHNWWVAELPDNTVVDSLEVRVTGPTYVVKFGYVQLMAPVGAPTPLTSCNLADIKVDGTSIAGFSPSTYSYTADGADVTSATAEDNMGITVIPAAGGRAYVVTLAEDGESTSLYTVNVTPPHDHVYGEWTVDQEATIYAPGSKSRHCTVPGCPHSEVVVIPMIARATNSWFDVVYPLNTDGTWSVAGGYTNYTPTVASASHRDVVINCRTRFRLSNDSTAPDTTDGVQTTLYVFPKGNIHCFKAWNGASWLELGGVVPTENPVDVMIEIRYEEASSDKVVRFTLGGTVLTDADTGAEWITLETSANNVSRIAFDGVITDGDFTGTWLGVNTVHKGLMLFVR